MASCWLTHDEMINGWQNDIPLFEKVTQLLLQETAEKALKSREMIAPVLYLDKNLFIIGGIWQL